MFLIYRERLKLKKLFFLAALIRAAKKCNEYETHGALYIGIYSLSKAIWRLNI